MVKFQKIAKTVTDRLFAAVALVVLSPVMLIAAVGIRVSSKGSILYCARRMGKDMKPITVYKFRTMKVGADKEGAITGIHDSRVFAWGEILRKTKIDELPQLVNILNGTMSVIGPRPEDIDIVNNYYTEEEKATLSVLPGLASPGSIFNYTHGERYMSGDDTDKVYTEKFLHIKLALDLYYLRHWSLWYDAGIIFRTIFTILAMIVGRNSFPYPKEYRAITGKR